MNNSPPPAEPNHSDFLILNCPCYTPSANFSVTAPRESEFTCFFWGRQKVKISFFQGTTVEVAWIFRVPFRASRLPPQSNGGQTKEQDGSILGREKHSRESSLKADVERKNLWWKDEFLFANKFAIIPDFQGGIRMVNLEWFTHLDKAIEGHWVPQMCVFFFKCLSNAGNHCSDCQASPSPNLHPFTTATGHVSLGPLGQIYVKCRLLTEKKHVDCRPAILTVNWNWLRKNYTRKTMKNLLQKEILQSWCS